MMKTTMATAKMITPKWYMVDAADKVLGRLATEVAHRLRGKHRASFTPHENTGDFVIIINASKIKVTGNKAQDKIYYHHSEYPGGIKGEAFAKLIKRKPEKILETAVKGMLPKGPLGRSMFSRLKVYADANHPHEAQKPELIELL